MYRGNLEVELEASSMNGSMDRGLGLRLMNRSVGTWDCKISDRFFYDKD